MPERLSKLADSYLDHIKIAVEADDRGAPFRTFIDNWNAFQSDHSHHRSKGDRPRWFNNPCALTRVTMFETLDFRSKGAAAIIEEAARDPKTYKRRRGVRDRSAKLIVDHSIPVGVLVSDLFSGKVELTREGIRQYLNAHYRLGLLSDEEDRRLNSMGLRSAMPSGWDERDVFARYRVGRIVFQTTQ